MDFGGFQELRQLCPDPLRESEVKERWLASPAVRDHETGRIDPDEFARRFTAEWRLSLSADAFLESFASWPRGAFLGAESLLRSLRPRYRLACLTNSNPVHWPVFASLLPHLDEVFASHQMGLLKPDARVFEHVLGHLAVPPERVAFFDDSLPNVEAAEQVGMRAFHVVGLEELRLALGKGSMASSDSADRTKSSS